MVGFSKTVFFYFVQYIIMFFLLIWFGLLFSWIHTTFYISVFVYVCAYNVFRVVCLRPAISLNNFHGILFISRKQDRKKIIMIKKKEKKIQQNKNICQINGTLVVLLLSIFVVFGSTLFCMTKFFFLLFFFFTRWIFVLAIFHSLSFLSHTISRRITHTH